MRAASRASASCAVDWPASSALASTSGPASCCGDELASSLAASSGGRQRPATHSDGLPSLAHCFELVHATSQAWLISSPQLAGTDSQLAFAASPLHALDEAHGKVHTPQMQASPVGQPSSHSARKWVSLSTCALSEQAPPSSGRSAASACRPATLGELFRRFMVMSLSRKNALSAVHGDFVVTLW
jgi:hypothetical protein